MNGSLDYLDTHLAEHIVFSLRDAGLLFRVDSLDVGRSVVMTNTDMIEVVFVDVILYDLLGSSGLFAHVSPLCDR